MPQAILLQDVEALGEVLRVVRERAWPAEVVVVNDGSTDRTAAIVAEFAQLNPEVRLLNNPANRGKGFSVRHGVLNAVGEIVMFTDADLSAPMEEAERLFDALHQGARIAALPSCRQGAIEIVEHGQQIEY